MAIKDSNKGSHFVLDIRIPMNLYRDDRLKNRIETEIDVILARMTATNEVYKFESKDKLIYVFGTQQRKRKGQLDKIIEKTLIQSDIIDEYRSTGLLRNEFINYVQELKKKQSLQLSSEPLSFEGYKGEDLEIFSNKDKWYPWQKDLHNRIFFKTGGIREAHPREIITLYDEQGNSGKSSFFKYLYYKYTNDIGRVTYGSASQLRSSLTHIGVKRIYIIDLTRTKSSNDKPSDLISAIEDLKNGLVCNAMYGEGNTMLMNPPHIIISANYIFDQSFLSKDRWKIFSIQNKQLKDITLKIQANELIKK